MLYVIGRYSVIGFTSRRLFFFNGPDGFCVSLADSTLDSGMGSTVYSDSHSSQQSVLYQSLLEPITMATQQVCIWERAHPAWIVYVKNMCSETSWCTCM